MYSLYKKAANIKHLEEKLRNCKLADIEHNDIYKLKVEISRSREQLYGETNIYRKVHQN